MAEVGLIEYIIQLKCLGFKLQGKLLKLILTEEDLLKLGDCMLYHCCSSSYVNFLSDQGQILKLW